MWRSIQRWRGVALVGIATVATIVLTLSNQLQLYIHPRYIVFTVAMMLIAVVLLVASVLSRSAGSDDAADAEPSRRSRLVSYVGVGVAAALAISMLALPPATLTSATADQRDINSTALGSNVQDAAAVASAPVAAFANFTVIDWASLLRQTTDLGFYEGNRST